MHKENFIMGIYWLDHKITAGQYIALVYRFLKALKDFSSDFNHPKIVGKSAEVKEISSTFDEFQNELLPLLQQHDNWYRDAAGNKSELIQLDSFSDTGFFREIIFDKEDEAILISINAGNFSGDNTNKTANNVLIEFPGNDNKYTDFNYMMDLFQLTIELWDPKVGWVISREFRRRVNNGSNTFIGWLNYFSDKKIKKFIPDNINTVNFHAGFISYLSNKVPFAENKEDVDKAIMLRDKLNNNNLLNWR